MSVHTIIGVAMMCARSLTLFSLVYINYPTQVIFKSMKLLTVLIGSVLFFEKKYSMYEVFGHIAMVISALCFTLGDSQKMNDINSKESNDINDINDINDLNDLNEIKGLETNESIHKFEFYGIILVSLSLIADSVHANYQEYALKVKNATTSELMIFSNFIAGMLSFVACIVSQEWINAIYFVGKHPSIIILFFIRSMCIFFGAIAYLALTKRFGAVMASEVTTARKVITIITSYLFFPKPFIFKHKLGSMLFAISIAITVYAKRKTQQSKIALNNNILDSCDNNGNQIGTNSNENQDLV